MKKYFKNFLIILKIIISAEWTGEAKVDAAEVFFQWEKEKHASITGFRNSSFKAGFGKLYFFKELALPKPEKSIYTGHQAPPVPVKWTEDLS